MAIQTQGDYDFTGSRNWTSPYVRYVPTRPKQQQLQKTNFRHEHRQWLPFICGPQCTGDGDIFTGRHTVYQDGGRFDPSKASLTHSSNAAQACWPINSFSVSSTIDLSRKENPQKLTQLSPRSHPSHLVGKRTAQKDAIKDITSDSQVNSYLPHRWPLASLTINIYFYIYI